MDTPSIRDSICLQHLKTTVEKAMKKMKGKDASEKIGKGTRKRRERVGVKMPTTFERKKKGDKNGRDSIEMTNLRIQKIKKTGEKNTNEGTNILVEPQTTKEKGEADGMRRTGVEKRCQRERKSRVTTKEADN
jgi:hypothetical protein